MYLHSLDHDCIFENPEAMEHECQSSKHPLHVRVQDTEWDDDQNTQYGQVIQNVLPVQKVVKENIFCSIQKQSGSIRSALFFLTLSVS